MTAEENLAQIPRERSGETAGARLTCGAIDLQRSYPSALRLAESQMPAGPPPRLLVYYVQYHSRIRACVLHTGLPSGPERSTSPRRREEEQSEAVHLPGNSYGQPSDDSPLSRERRTCTAGILVRRTTYERLYEIPVMSPLKMSARTRLMLGDIYSRKSSDRYTIAYMRLKQYL